MKKGTGTRKIKNIVDLLMVVTLLLLMPYGLIGEKVHELFGICINVTYKQFCSEWRSENNSQVTA